MKKGGHRARFPGTTLTNTGIRATLIIAAHPQCWTNLVRFYKCNPTYKAESSIIPYSFKYVPEKCI